MSFRLQPTPPARPNRCQLFGPGSNVKLFAKMAASAADVINLDLEDSVSPSDKDSARANVIEAVNTIDWNTKTLSVRINSLDTPYWYPRRRGPSGTNRRPPRSNHDPEGRLRRRHLRS